MADVSSVLDVLMTIDEPELFYLYEQWCDSNGGQTIYQMDEFSDVVGDQYTYGQVGSWIDAGHHFDRNDFYFDFNPGLSLVSFDDLLDYMTDELSSELEDMAQYVIDNDNPTDIWELDEILHSDDE